MNTEEVISVLGIPEDLADALVAAGTSILSAAPELAKNASHDLDMYSWYHDDEHYGYPGWMTAIADNDKDQTPLAIFDVVQYPAAPRIDGVQYQPSRDSFQTDDPMLVAFLAYRNTLDTVDEDLHPVHHVGNGVLLGVLATRSSEYAFEVVNAPPASSPDEEVDPPFFRALFRGGKLDSQYMVVIHPDLYVSRTFTITGVVKH